MNIDNNKYSVEIRIILSYLEKAKNTNNLCARVAISYHLFKYLDSNSHFLDGNIKFKTAVIKKANDLYHDISNNKIEYTESLLHYKNLMLNLLKEKFIDRYE